MNIAGINITTVIFYLLNYHFNSNDQTVGVPHTIMRWTGVRINK